MSYKCQKLPIAFCLFIIILAGGAAKAQLLVGPKIGVQASRFSFADHNYGEQYRSRFKPGFNIGGVLQFKVKKPFSLHTEFFYSRKGKYIEGKEHGAVRSKATYHHLDVPILLRLTFDKNIKGTKFQYYFNVGPNFSYWLGGKGILEADELIEFGYDQLAYKIVFVDERKKALSEGYGKTLYITGANRLLANLEIGGGFMFEVGRNQKLMIDFRYGFGIGNTFLGKEDGGDFGLYYYFENFEAVNNVLSFSAAYLFDLNVMRILKKGKYQ